MILCHIVGINNKLKTNFVTEMLNISANIMILDLDDISKKIIFEQEYNLIYNEFILNNKTNNNNKIVLLSKLSHIWKDKFTNKVNQLLTQHKEKCIILIGQITFYLDYRIKIVFNEDIKNKFFINTSTHIYSTQQIEHNIDVYRKDIIKGSFPLKYLDFSFLKLQREQLREQYMTRDYKLKNYDTIINWIEHTLKNIMNGNINNLNPVYFASFKRHENNINMISDTIVGYSEKWLALISLFPKNKFKRGITFKQNIKSPYIKELGPLNMSELNCCCYLYEFYPSKKVDEYRYLIEDNNFIKRHYVSNIKNELDLNGTIFDKY